jgi:hypothetical protein
MIAKTTESKPVKSQKRSYLAYAAKHSDNSEKTEALKPGTSFN